MIIPYVSAASAYSAGNEYDEDDQYGDDGLTSSRYGDEYGTGTYSDYSTTRGEYSTKIEISRYGSTSSSGYGYGSGGTDDGYGTVTDSSSDYGYTAGDVVHSYEDSVLDYVVDVLDGDLERKPDRVGLYIPVDTST